jgi:hypothetical protein
MDEFSWKEAMALKEGEGAEWRLNGRWLTTWKDSSGQLVTRFMTEEEVRQSRRCMASTAVRKPFRDAIDAAIALLPEGADRTGHVEAIIAAMKAVELVAAQGVSNGQ